jgi:hypothetical protein
MSAQMLDEWLRNAPKPEPLPQGKRFHLFISYRSVNRAWVLKLYDTLRGLGYQPFLDQYELAAAAPLASSLSDALRQSQAAVMIWSSSFEDSAWCMSEFNALEAKEAAGKGFRYVIAKVDQADLPDLVLGKIFVDFSADRDGPTGSALLQLLYGLRGANGEPLPEPAIRLSAIVDDQSKKADVAIKAAFEIGKADRLVELSKSTDLAWQTSPALGCAVAEALIGLKQVPQALELISMLGERFPRALRPKQLQGLALARAGRTDDAQLVLGELYKSGEIDPETLGIYGRTWMDRYNATQQRLYLLKSRDFYRQAFEAAPQNFYTGINAASKSVLLGEAETAQQLAARVQKLVGAVAVPGDYWKTATVAEVQLLQGNFDAAAARYLDAVLISPEAHGSHGSSRDQARLLLNALNAPAQARARVLEAFEHPGCV